MKVFDLETCVAIVNASVEDALTMLEVDDAEKQEGLSYQKLSDLTMYYNPAVLSARVYISSAKVEMVYVPSGEWLRDITPKQLEEKIGGGAPTRLRSRSGKKASHYVHPEQGIAYSSQKDKVLFVEVFQSRPLEAYLEQIYEEPGPFIR
jgi:hypothetical protein